jgi:transcriptional regulator
MYVPAPFRDDDTSRLVRFMRRNAFATLVTQGDGGPLATHLPLAVAHEGDGIVLRGHVARANPQWRAFAAGDVLAIFAGPHAYVSPTHYDRRESVPTWNYVAVHAYGTARTVDDEGEVRALLEELIGLHERSYRAQWDALPGAYRRKMTAGVVAFEVEVTRLEGAAKLSQNKSREEQRRIAEALTAGEDAAARETGAEMMRRLEAPTDGGGRQPEGPVGEAEPTPAS